MNALELLQVPEQESKFLLAENQINELAEVFFAAKKDLLCSKIVQLRWQNTIDVLKQTLKGGSLPEPT